MFRSNLEKVISNNNCSPYTVRLLGSNDIKPLSELINRQGSERLKYFRPHGFDLKSLYRISRNHAFFMMGVFEGEVLAGYFFLRCFINKKCFVGRLVDIPYEGKGIGRIMNQIMYNTAWESGFRCLSTISKNNKYIMKAHAGNNSLRVIKELDNNYLFVEFVKPGNGSNT